MFQAEKTPGGGRGRTPPPFPGLDADRFFHYSAAMSMRSTDSPAVILAGICGGIAAYKCAEVVSRLTQAGHEVHVAMTPAAQKFVTPTTFASLSRRRVLTEMFPPPGETSGEDLFPHLYPASRADLFVVMPATAATLARLAQGLADDVVSASALALPPACRKVFCPAMNAGMWASAPVQRNVAQLEAAGWIRVGPAEGELACGVSGPGRLAEPRAILDALHTLLTRGRLLAGRRVLVLSGPTREHLDPVRFLGNASSGRMGRALALEAVGLGATVDFVTGPVAPAQLPSGPGITLHPVVSAADMLAAGRRLAPRADLLIYAAAVADYTPAETSAVKPAKSAKPPALRLRPTPDIAATLSRDRRKGQIAVGFALESGLDAGKAHAKLAKKHLDAIVLNGPESMDAPSAAFQWIPARPAGAAAENWNTLTKQECARRIFERLMPWLPARRPPRGAA